MKDLLHSKNVRPSAGLQRALRAQAGLDNAGLEMPSRPESLYSAMQQYRTSRTLRHIEQLTLPRGAKILELGCGGGMLGLTLAKRGYNLEAVDIAHSSGGLARLLTMEAGRAPVSAEAPERLRLPFPDRGFDLVVAVGVLPNFPGPDAPVQELARVLKCGGFAIVSVDNFWQIGMLLDPAAWLRRLSPFGKGAPQGFRCRPSRLNRALKTAGLLRLSGESFGFGPFSIFGRRLRPETVNLKLNSRLQEWSDQRKWPVAVLLSRTGAQYLSVARKTL